MGKEPNNVISLAQARAEQRSRGQRKTSRAKKPVSYNAVIENIVVFLDRHGIHGSCAPSAYDFMMNNDEEETELFCQAMASTRGMLVELEEADAEEYIPLRKMAKKIQEIAAQTRFAEAEIGQMDDPDFHFPVSSSAMVREIARFFDLTFSNYPAFASLSADEVINIAENLPNFLNERVGSHWRGSLLP